MNFRRNDEFPYCCLTALSSESEFRNPHSEIRNSISFHFTTLLDSVKLFSK